MVTNKAILGLLLALTVCVSGCSRQQSDWEKTRAANTIDSYEQFIRKYPGGEFTGQAQARVKELYEERDWQKARDSDTLEAYQAFVKQYPEGKWTEEARIRVENFSLAQTPSNGTPGAADAANTPGAPSAGETGASPVAPTPPHSPPAPPAARSPAPATSTQPASGAHAVRSAASKPDKPRRNGSFGVQLGAFKSSEAAANRRWAHLEKEYPKLLAGLSPAISPKTGDSGTLYRLQVTGLSEKRARTICKSLKARSQACVVVPPPHQ